MKTTEAEVNQDAYDEFLALLLQIFREASPQADGERSPDESRASSAASQSASPRPSDGLRGRSSS